MIISKAGSSPFSHRHQTLYLIIPRALILTCEPNVNEHLVRGLVDGHHIASSPFSLLHTHIAYFVSIRFVLVDDEAVAVRCRDEVGRCDEAP